MFCRSEKIAPFEHAKMKRLHMFGEKGFFHNTNPNHPYICEYLPLPLVVIYVTQIIKMATDFLQPKVSIHNLRVLTRKVTLYTNTNYACLCLSRFDAFTLSLAKC